MIASVVPITGRPFDSGTARGAATPENARLKTDRKFIAVPSESGRRHWIKFPFRRMLNETVGPSVGRSVGRSAAIWHFNKMRKAEAGKLLSRSSNAVCNSRFWPTSTLIVNYSDFTWLLVTPAFMNNYLLCAPDRVGRSAFRMEWNPNENQPTVPALLFQAWSFDLFLFASRSRPGIDFRYA